MLYCGFRFVSCLVCHCAQQVIDWLRFRTIFYWLVFKIFDVYRKMFGLYWPIRVSLFFTLLLFSQCRSRSASSQPGSLSPSSTDQASVALDAKPAASLVRRLLPEVQQIFAKRAKQLQKDSKLVEEVRNGVGELIEQLKQPADLAVQKLAIIGDLGRGGVVKQWDMVRSEAEELVTAEE